MTILTQEQATVGTTLSLALIKKHGMETWVVAMGGTILHSFLSEQAARARFRQVLQRLAAGIA
jgi:hypothetical protein